MKQLLTMFADDDADKQSLLERAIDFEYFEWSDDLPLSPEKASELAVNNYVTVTLAVDIETYIMYYAQTYGDQFELLHSIAFKGESFPCDPSDKIVAVHDGTFIVKYTTMVASQQP